jgi:hypothetical protein
MALEPVLSDEAATPASLRQAECAVAELDAAMGAGEAWSGDAATTLPVKGVIAPLAAAPCSPRNFLSYELGPKIGAGGMGTVHRAVHVWLGRPVAIKFIAPNLVDSPEMAERFRHEALAVGKLQHPNIVTATDAGRYEGIHYLVTEFVDGQDLSSVVRRRGWLDVNDACEATRQAALGLAHAHEQGIVHRDVKPGNLLLSKQGDIKLLDFGLARLAAAKTMLTNTGQVLGTLDFLAPEQAGDPRRVDSRGDQYSLGCTLYYLLSGAAPFSGPAYDSPASKLKAHLVDAPRPIRELRQRVPLGLATIIDRMLSKNPADRFADLLEVARALTPYCRRADLSALVGGERSERTSDCRRGRPSHGAFEAFWEQAAALLGMAVRAVSQRRDTSAATAAPRRGPMVGVWSLVALAFLAFVLSRVSCVEITEQGPAGPGGAAEKTKVFEIGFGNVPLPAPALPGSSRGPQGSAPGK